jgi:hypothetical protein
MRESRPSYVPVHEAGSPPTMPWTCYPGPEFLLNVGKGQKRGVTNVSKALLHTAIASLLITATRNDSGHNKSLLLFAIHTDAKALPTNPLKLVEACSWDQEPGQFR